MENQPIAISVALLNQKVEILDERSANMEEMTRAIQESIHALTVQVAVNHAEIKGRSDAQDQRIESIKEEQAAKATKSAGYITFLAAVISAVIAGMVEYFRK